MKIGIDARLWDETGVGRYIRNLVTQLAEIDKTNEYVLFVKHGFKHKELGLNKDTWKFVETSIYWHSLREQLVFPKVLYKENLDLMHFPYFAHPILYNRPFVITIHDLIMNHFPTGKASTLPYPLYTVKRFGYHAVINHAVTASSKIIVPLHAVKEDVMRTLHVDENKIAVTYEGVEKSKVKSPASQRGEQNSKVKENFFLYVGNAYPHKNLDYLIDSFLAFNQEVKEAKLVIVGKDDYFYKRLRKKTLQENIIFENNVSDEALFALYANAKAFISASRMEGFGLPPLEAMSMSCPVLLSDIPSFREVCKDAAFYFDLAAKNSLKEQMNLLYNLDQKTRDEHIKKGVARVTQFSWEKMAAETKEIYESCISLRQSQ